MRLKLISYGPHKDPTRSHWNDSGLDVYSTGEFVLKPNSPVKIPLNIGFNIPNGYELQLRPRSSMNAKGVLTQFGTIDAGYDGNIAAVLVNLIKDEISVHDGDKIAQLVLCPVVYFDVETKEGKEEERGGNGFGSTGR